MKYKRGTTFDFTGVVEDDTTHVVQNITGWTIEAQLRKEVGGRADALIATLVGEVLDGPAGVYRVRAASIEATKTWELCDAVFDIVFVTPDGDRVPTEDFIKVKIIDPATQAA